MPRRRIVDSAKLLKAVKEGKLDKEVINKFGLNTPSRSAEKEPRKYKGDKPDMILAGNVKINKSKSLVLPKEMVEALGFAKGDQFVVRRTKAGIHLRPSSS
jgi:AbrB family looped-hinge helix DNA binding protein